MSSGPPVWPAQDEHESRTTSETRPRRSRRKKDDDAATTADTDRKEPAKSTRGKEKKEDKETLKKAEMDSDKKESKRPSRRQRDKSLSMSNNNPTNAATQSTPSNPRKKPKLEPTPPDQSPNSAPAVPAAPSPTPASMSTPAPVPAPTPAALIPAPKLSPPMASAPVLANHTQQSPHQQVQQTRPPHPTSQLLFSSHHPTPAASTPATPSPYSTMVSAPPSRPQSQPLGPPPPQRTSGQNYDPIRSAFDTTSSTPAPPAAPIPTSFSPPPRPVSPRPFRASASPAISSIIDPPQNASPPQYAPRPYGSPGRSASSYPPTPAAPAVAPTHSQLPPSSSTYGHQSPYGPPPQVQLPQESHTPARLISPQAQPVVPEPKPSAPQLEQTTTGPTPMEVDNELAAPVVADKVPKKESKPVTAPSSKPPSPKPSRTAKEAPPPLPQGSGLISNALFGGTDDSASDTSTQRTPNIIVHIPLQGNGNKIINFARLAEEQYGFAALYPQVAARQERMARVAAAGAALERNDRSGRGISAGESADEDLSLEVDRDSELEGAGALGTTAAQANEPADGKKRRRRRKMEEYDRDDPFVDDSEMVWQEQAAASKDGYFVYSGPLVAEGEKVQVERADGTIKRGRGRGRGGRGRGPATTHQQLPLAAAIPISQETGLPVRGPGSRGGNINRRPRVSKKAEQDKANGPTSGSHGRGGGGAGRGGSTGSRGGKTPMVELAPRPSLAPAPPALNPMGGPEIGM
ncbi:hypothetical protein BJY01DRAFT_205928, partial [Aspergillus pseudoustus]